MPAMTTTSYSPAKHTLSSGTATKATKSNPLPQPDAELVKTYDLQPNALAAYNLVRDFAATVAGDEDSVRCLKVVGCLLLEAPFLEAKAEIARAVNSCSSAEECVALGKVYEGFLASLFRPRDVCTPSRPEENPVIDKNNKVHVDHFKAQHRTLKRDGWKSVATGVIDRRAPALPEKLKIFPIFPIFSICTHILPEGTSLKLGNVDEVANSAPSASLRAFLKAFDYDVDEFNGSSSKFHSLPNLITLDSNSSQCFGRLWLYFDATDTPDHYILRNGTQHAVLQPVTFTTSDAEKLPLPCAKFLALHATCCKVAHISGTGMYLERLSNPDYNFELSDGESDSD